jgi:hypothetical protein
MADAENAAANERLKPGEYGGDYGRWPAASQTAGGLFSAAAIT